MIKRFWEFLFLNMSTMEELCSPDGTYNYVCVKTPQYDCIQDIVCDTYKEMLQNDHSDDTLYKQIYTVVTLEELLFFKDWVDPLQDEIHI